MALAANHTYSNENLKRFHKVYGNLHGWISLVICVVGIFFNIVSITVLRQRHMINIINTIIAALAITDILCMASYIIFAFQVYIPTMKTSQYHETFYQSFFILIYYNISTTLYLVTIYIALFLALYRCMLLYFPLFCLKNLGIYEIKCILFCLFLFAIFINIPFYMSYQVSSLHQNNVTFYYHATNKAHSNLLTVNVILFSVNKIVPCLLFIIFTVILSLYIYKANRTRKRLKMGKKKDIKASDQTTILLILIMICFEITHLPSGIMALLCMDPMLGSEFQQNVYTYLGDIFDTIALINNSINFILYSLISQQFRLTFKNISKDLFRKLFKIFQRPPLHNSVLTNSTHLPDFQKETLL